MSKAAAYEIRKRLRDDFAFYAEKALKIRTKDAQIVPLVLNTAQQMLVDAINKQEAEKGYVRIIILKGRQQGLSTGVGGYLYGKTSQGRGRKAIVVTHKSDSTNALFNMTKRYHENVPPFLKPSTSYSSKKELVFDKLDSSYMVATAGGDAIARGETITHAHLSELAFWRESTARDNLNGLLESVPDVPNTAVFIESTANGVTGPFYEYWKAAEAGENGYYPLFIPWFLDPGYTTRVPKDFERTPEEDEIAARALVEWAVELTNGQFQWRRVKVSQKGRDLFRQEYPCYPDEAFLTTGRPVFDVENLAKLKAASLGPVQRMSHLNRRFDTHPTGELSLYREIDPGQTYYIGADVAMGVRDGDYSVAQVLDDQKRQAAVYRSRIHPDYFADVLYDLGMMFNTAKIAVENNNHGLLTVNRLYKDLTYPNVFTNVTEDQMTDIETPQLGFRTTVKSKPLIIDDLRAAQRKGELKLHDRVTMDEMMTYVVKESGKTEAEESCHDDCVMALAIANHIHDGVYTPIRMSHDHYVEAI